MSFIYSEVERIIKKFGTRDPYELLDAIGAVTKFSNEYPCDGLKGYCTILNRFSYAVVNANLDDADMKIVAGHEAAHLIVHRNQILSSPVKAMQDFDLFNSTGIVEREANEFLADFIVADEDTLEAISYNDDYFATARELYIPAPLLAFKLYSMMRRGYKVRSPVDLDSRFLGKDNFGNG